MKTTLQIVLLLVAFPCLAEEPANPNSALNQFAPITELSRAAAKEKASEMARNDFAQGRYRILVFGMRREGSPSDKFLQKQYGVTTDPIAGCLVSDGILGTAEGYNSTMKPLLNEKFGKDIFKEAEKATQASR